MSEDRARKSDDAIIRIEAALTDIQGRLVPLEDLFKKLDTPVKVVTWLLAAMFVAFFGAVGMKLFNWIASHF